ARGRDRGKEGFRCARSFERRLEVADVGLKLRVALVRDRPGAHHMRKRRGGARQRAAEPFVELGKRPELARAGEWAPLALGVDLEAGEALVDVRDEAGFPHLAVVDDVDAELDLLGDDGFHGGADARREAGGVVRLAFSLGLDELQQVGGTGQAARVGGEDAAFAALHAVSSSFSIFFSSAARRSDLLKGTPAFAYQ